MSLRIEALDRRHDVGDFDCGSEPLNQFLSRFALVNQRANAARTWVACDGDQVVGFYSLAVGEVAYEDAPERLKKGLARHPVPTTVLARIGVSIDRQGQRLGRGLTKDSILRTLAAADLAGIRAMIIHAKDENARAFYQHLGFKDALTNPLHVYRLVSDLRRDVLEG